MIRLIFSLIFGLLGTGFMFAFAYLSHRGADPYAIYFTGFLAFALIVLSVANEIRYETNKLKKKI